jgi:lipopolysaccharide assembly outer membrane protein LptD (OstA)
MTVGRALRLGLAAALLAVGVFGAGDRPAAASSVEVRVQSRPGQPTVVTVQAAPDAVIEDRTPGAKPATDGQGAASQGETFSDEITFVVRGVQTPRPAQIDVADALVSTVRLFPDPAGTQIVVFVRQPVTYAIARPTATGAVVLTLRARNVATAAAAPAKPGQRRPPRPKTPEGESDQVTVDAEELQYDQQANVLIARGGVTLTRGATTLRADEVRYDRDDSVAEAKGHVVLVDPEATVEGDAARLDLTNETGWVENAQGDMKQSPYRLTGDHVEKHGGPCYTVQNGVFTTCRCGGVEPPSWSIAGKETEVTLQGIGQAKHATFRVEDVPVLYFPYFIFPANTDRQSGFLFPRLGYSNRRGFLYEQPFFWAIDKSQDATVTLDMESNARVGIIGEYRYAWSRTTSGIFTGAYFNESIGGTPETLTPLSAEDTDRPTDRWVVAGRHRAIPWENANLYLDVLRISDNNFLREIRAFSSTVSTDIQIRSTRFTKSRLGLVQTWDGGGAQAETTSYQDLIDPQEFALDRLPRLAAEHSMPFFGGLLVGRLPGELVNFHREEGYQGLRVDVAPELFAPFHVGRYVSASVRGQVRETAYHLTDTQQVGFFVPDNPGVASTFVLGGKGISRLDTDTTRELGQVQSRVASEIGRVYDFPYLGLTRIRHTIEPEVQYLFVPQVGRDMTERAASIPNPSVPGARFHGTFFGQANLFDEVDAINQRNFVSYGVTTRILGRAGTTTPAASETTAESEEEATPGGTGLDEEGVPDVRSPLEEIDPDTLPTGLEASTVPPFGDARKAPKGAAVPAPTAVASSRELMRASVLQGYDFSRKLGGRSHLSDIDAVLRVTPVSWGGITYNTTFDVENGKTLQQAVGLVLREPWWTPPTDRPNFQNPTSIGVQYRFIDSNAGRDFVTGPERRFFTNANDVEEIDGAFYLRITDYLGFAFLARYALAPTVGPNPDDPNLTKTFGPRFLERDYLARFISKCNCWILEAGLSERSDTNDTTFRVQFTLYGLGTFGQGPAQRGLNGLAGLQTLGYRRPWALGKE